MGILAEATTEIQVRFVDLDVYNHVNNAVYLTYMETARLALVKDIFFSDMEKNIQYLLIHIELDYLQPVGFEDRLLVHCWFEEVLGARFKIGYHMHDGAGKSYARGYTVHALFNTVTKKPMRIPAGWINYLK